MAKTILVIDDDRTLIRAIEKVLQEHEYQVFTANDGLEGLSVFQKGGIDLVLLDIEMPTMNGYSFLFELRKLRNGVNTPVIVLTCKDKMEDIFRVEGVREYVIKPVNSTVLLEIIKKHI